MESFPVRRFFRPGLAVSVCSLIALSAAAQTAGKTSLTLSAVTTRTVIPGLDKLPPEARASLQGLAAGQRGLTVTLQKPGAPPANPTAELDIPAGLKQGPKLILSVPNDKPGIPGADSGVFKTLENWEIRRYWGCAETVRAGQPQVLKGKDLGLNGGRGAGVSGAAGAADAFTYAYWPNEKQQNVPIVPDAALPGKYTLRSNFVNGVSFDVPAGVNFVPAAEVTVDGAPDLKQPIRLRWKPVPGAIGFLAVASGSRGQNGMIQWTSAEDGTHPRAWAASGEDAKATVQKGIYMKPEKTECVIPTGVFDGCAAVSLVFYAVGPTFEDTRSTPSVRLETMSMSMVPIQSGRGN